MKVSHIIFASFGAVILFGLGRMTSPQTGAGVPASESGSGEASAEKEDAVWSCPMHAQIRLPEFGPCPVCGMDLVPLAATGEGPRQLVLSESAAELARIATAPVVRKSMTRAVRMVGKIDFDETAVRTITAWVPGRLDRMFVDYTGVRVNAGDHLVSLYSPDLLSAQEELLSSAQRIKSTADESSEFLAESNRRAYQAARGKLLLWGLTEEQVNAIETRGSAEDHMMLTSPNSGVVIDKLLNEGAYVTTGTPIYRIADLDEVWVRLDAYEKDLVWLRYGQKVSIEAEALPGELLQGRISFIDYIIGDRTRTAKVRVNVENLDGRLKPGMFVRAVAEAHVGAGGRVLEQFLAGKWVCPMHHEVVRDESGDCSVCQMPLKLAEELGLTGTEGSGVEEPLVIPRTAALITGKRAIVFVAVPNTESPTYEGREIVLGPRTGEHYIVGSGLEEGEEVVVNGAFRLDSSMQILAKPSMMTMTKDILGHSGPEVVAFLGSLDGIYAAYFEMQRALGGDDFDAAKVGATHIQEALSKAEPGALSSDVRSTWDEIHKELSTVEERAQASATIKELRAEFQPISEAMLLLERRFGHSSEGTHKEAHCPMAFGNAGASWLQVGDEVYNPYYGDMMLNCGTIEKSYSAKGAQ